MGADLPGTLLLVDDDPNDQLLMLRAFREIDLPITVRTVDNGEEAISYMAGADSFSDRKLFPLPKVTLLDVKMPGRSGFEVLAWIRSQPSVGDSVVVMLSGSRQAEDIERAYKLGANSYLVKPNDPRELRSLNEIIVNYWVGNNITPAG
jgi:CheY-like chemotaxis protein